MSKLMIDCDQYKVINSEQSVLRGLFIYDCQSEPHYQHHKLSERSCHKIKLITNIIIDCTGSTD